jgi:hypothetical protein
VISIARELRVRTGYTRWVRPVILSLLLFTSVAARAQAPGVTIVRDRGEQFADLVRQANRYRDRGELLTVESVRKQLNRKTCSLQLPRPATKRLSDRAIWERCRDAHARVGWHYLCTKCDRWHQNLAGGYFITTDGAIATGFHVIQPGENLREGYLVAATDDGRLLPVTEILAGNEQTDTAIIRVKTDPGITPKPLALKTAVYPGDTVWCYSDPLGRSSYFSKGMVNRFFWLERKDQESPRIDVSTDWAPGSSGAAVVDECGNAIGHVSEISPSGGTRARGTNEVGRAGSALIIFHCASRAADVLSLVQPAKKR